MANWKRVLTEEDLTGGNILSGVVGGAGILSTNNNDGTYTLSIVDETVNGSGISIGENSIALDLDGSTLSTGANGVKVSDAGITNVQVASSIITGQAVGGTINATDDYFLVYSNQGGGLQKVSGATLASFVTTAGGGDYDFGRVNVTSGEISSLQFSLDGVVESQVQLVYQANETRITTGSEGGIDSIFIGLADDVQIHNSLIVNQNQAGTGVVFHVKDPADIGFQSTSQFDGNVVINGNLTVAGDTTATVVDTLNVEDSTFIINSDAGAGSITNGGMILNVNNTFQAKVEWQSSAALSGWTLKGDTANAAHQAAASTMAFMAGVPGVANESFGAGSFMYDTTNNKLYIDLS